jgi:predicted kinase
MSIEKVTMDFIEKSVVKTRYVYDDTLTIAIVTLSNGFKVTGESACMNPADYDRKLGKKLALDRALNKVWALEGYCRMSTSF